MERKSMVVSRDERMDLPPSGFDWEDECMDLPPLGFNWEAHLAEADRLYPFPDFGTSEFHTYVASRPSRIVTEDCCWDKDYERMAELSELSMQTMLGAKRGNNT